VLHQDARFRKNADRVRHREVIVPLVAEIMRGRTVGEWVALLEPIGVPVGPINDLAQTFAQAQVKSRGLQIELPHPLAGSVPGVANPIRMSATPPRYESAPPLLGQHTREVLQRFGIEDAQIEALARDGVI
jgi:crotonobetainyl-CoA:carnitine CoA-transferase CaiB-like acyl-CoA transferase